MLLFKLIEPAQLVSLYEMLTISIMFFLKKTIRNLFLTKLFTDVFLITKKNLLEKQL